jgi:hypothetical protein
MNVVEAIRTKSTAEHAIVSSNVSLFAVALILGASSLGTWIQRSPYLSAGYRQKLSFTAF